MNRARMWRWKPAGEVTLRFAQDENGAPVSLMQVCVCVCVGGGGGDMPVMACAGVMVVVVVGSHTSHLWL